MNLISFLDLSAFFAFLLAGLFALRNRGAGKGLPLVPVLLLVLLGLAASLAGALLWLGVSRVLSPVEELTSFLIPLAFFWFFISLIYQRRNSAQVSRNQVLAAIHAVTEKESHPEDPLGSVRDLMERVGTLLSLDFVALYQRHGEESLRLGVGWRLPPELGHSIDRLDPSITTLSRLLQSGEPLVVGRASNFPDPLTQLLDQAGIVSVAVFPLTTRSRAQGLLLVGCREEHFFSSEVLDLLRFLSRHLGEVLLNDSLAGRDRERALELSRVTDSRKLFLSMVSHDLRAPLSVVKGAMLVIHQYLDKASNEEVRRAVEMASASSRKLEKLIGDILDLARLDSGGVRLEFVPVDPVGELKTMVEEAKAEAGRKGVAIEVDLPARLPPIEVDKARFHQMVRNLLANSVKFTPSGGKITLSADSAGDNINVRVTDTGVGIPEDEIPRIFEMFYRGTAARPEHSGAGLGLSIVREVVRLHGGEIGVESRPGKGSAFTISLPRVHLP